MKKHCILCLLLCFGLVFCPMLSAVACPIDNLDELTAEVETFTENGQTYEVLCSATGTRFHEPVPDDIYCIRTIFTDGFRCGLYANMYDGLIGIHFLDNDYFTGFIYHDVINPCDGLVAVATADSGYGCLDTQGNIVVPCQWEWLVPYMNGLSLAFYDTTDDYGYRNVWLDRTGCIISLDPQYGYAVQLRKGAEPGLYAGALVGISATGIEQ